MAVYGQGGTAIDTSEFLIVGSGLTGATIARILHDAGRTVLVVERRSHVGGNVHDHVHASGIRVHTYGPHYFRTNSEDIWKFVNRFAPFYRYEAVVKSWVDAQHENWPISAGYIRRTIGERCGLRFTGRPTNFEEASLSLMPRPIYEKFVKGYTEKQWGVPAHTLSALLAKRFDVREDDDPRLTRHKYQGIPVDGYHAFMSNLLAGIPVLLNLDYLRWRDQLTARKRIIFTGPIDEFFRFDLGRLVYRALRRDHVYLPGVNYALPACQVNNPNAHNGPHIRTLEWKRMMQRESADRIQGTVLTKETPIAPAGPNHYEYPFPDDTNARLYDRYRERAEVMPSVIVCGRLGEYRYYDMDEIIGRAMILGQRLLSGEV